METLQAEVKARKEEEMRAALGSDYNSEEEREDVTLPSQREQPKRGFQPIEEQSACLAKVLEEIKRKQAESRPSGSREHVKTWLHDTSLQFEKPPPPAPRNTPANFQLGYQAP